MSTHSSNVIYLNDLRHIVSSSDRNNPDNPRNRYRILAEGDSWFTLGGSPPENVLQNLKFEKQNIILSLAEPGDKLINITDICNNPNWEKLTSKKFGYRWNALLISAGGNDVIAYLPKLLLSAAERSGKPVSGPQDYLNLGNVSVAMDHIVQGYRTLVAWRDRADSICSSVPLITHTYDYATPIDVPAKFFTIERGPWLYPQFDNAEIPEADFIPVADYLFDRLANILLGLELPNVFVVKTSGTLTRAALGATRESNDWLNEIHPNRGGYKKIAQLIGNKIKEVVIT